MKRSKNFFLIIAILVFLTLIINYVNKKLMGDFFVQDSSNHFILLGILFFSVIVLVLSIIFFDKKSF